MNSADATVSTRTESYSRGCSSRFLRPLPSLVLRHRSGVLKTSSSCRVRLKKETKNNRMFTKAKFKKKIQTNKNFSNLQSLSSSPTILCRLLRLRRWKKQTNIGLNLRFCFWDKSSLDQKNDIDPSALVLRHGFLFFTPKTSGRLCSKSTSAATFWGAWCEGQKSPVNTVDFALASLPSEVKLNFITILWDHE